jgi:hypothetical protein
MGFVGSMGVCPQLVSHIWRTEQENCLLRHSICDIQSCSGLRAWNIGGNPSPAPAPFMYERRESSASIRRSSCSKRMEMRPPAYPETQTYRRGTPCGRFPSPAHQNAIEWRFANLDGTRRGGCRDPQTEPSTEASLIIMEVVAGACALPHETTSPGGWTPIPASHTTTQAVPDSRSAGKSVTHGEPPAELETFDSTRLEPSGLHHISHSHSAAIVAPIITGSAQQGYHGRGTYSGSKTIRSARAEEFGHEDNVFGTTRHLDGGFGDPLRVHGRSGDKTQVRVVRVLA